MVCYYFITFLMRSYDLRKRKSVNYSQTKVNKSKQREQKKIKEQPHIKIIEKRKTEITNMAETLTISLDSVLNALPPFKGDSTLEIKDFLDSFDAVVAKTQLSDAVKILLLKTKIIGKAKEKILNDDNIRNEIKYDDLKNKLLSKFKTTVNFLKAQDDFMSLKQKPEQTVEDFAFELEKKSKDFLRGSGHMEKDGAKAFVEDLKFNKFMEGIRPNLAFEIRKLNIQEFEAAVKLAKIVENAQIYNTEELNTVKHDNKDNDEIYTFLVNRQYKQSEEIEKLMTELKELKLAASKEIRETKQEIKKFCDICKTTSHITDICWYNAKVYPNGDLTRQTTNNIASAYNTFPNSNNDNNAQNYHTENGRQNLYNHDQFIRGRNRGNSTQFRRQRATNRYFRGGRGRNRYTPQITYPTETGQNLNR